MNTLIDWSWPEWSLQKENTNWSLFHANGELLIEWKEGFPLLPETGSGKANLARAVARRVDANEIEFVCYLSGLAETSECRLRLQRHSDHLELSSSFEATDDGALFAWDILPPGTLLNLYAFLHIRNRHSIPRIVERYALGSHLTGSELGDGGSAGGFRISTDSRDWQFAPHPSFCVMEKHESHCFLGIKDLPQGFGMVVEKGEEPRRLTRWSFNCGKGTFRFRKGETVQSPVFCFFVHQGGDFWDTVDHWVDILIREKRIPDPTSREPFSEAMLKPYLGPWVDQCYFGRMENDDGMVWNWGGESDDRVSKIQAVCTEKFIRAEVEKAEAHGLNFGSVGIDDRWFHWRGDYELHKGRFPDIRRLVDWIHSKGLKVLLWWPPFDVEPQSKMNLRTEWLAGNGAKTKHGQVFIDYSNPAVQEEFLLPKLHLWLSDAPGCWNVDGFKLDFMADKVPDSIPLYDRSWHGEEMFIWRWHQLVYRTMKAIKPDSIMLGCTPHPYFAQYQDWVRTYDVWSTDYREHTTRGLRIRHLCPGPLLSYDYHGAKERFDSYLQQALADRAHIEIGNLFGFTDGTGAVSHKDLGSLKYYLDEHKPKPGLRYSPSFETQARIWSLQ